MRTYVGDSSVFLGSLEWNTYVDAFYRGKPTVQGLKVSGGHITFDRDADVQATLECTVSDESGRLVPVVMTDPLAPFGQQLHVTMAATMNGVQAIAPTSIGWYRTRECEPETRWYLRGNGTWKSGGSEITLTAPDRMDILNEAEFLNVDQPASGVTVLSEIKRLLEGMVPMGDVDVALSDAAVPSSVVYQENRVHALQDLAAVIGGECVIDPYGALRVRRPTQYGATPVWSFTVGPGRGDILEYKAKMTRDGVVNAVVAEGETATDHAQIRGVAYDTDSQSPTYWGGPFGQVPLRYASPLLTTPSMCQAAAQTRMNNYRRGREREYTAKVMPNFLVELDDPVQLILPDRIVPGRLTKITLPLAPDLMEITVRALDTSIVLLG